MREKLVQGMRAGDAEQYNRLLGFPPELPEALVKRHKRFSLLYERNGGGVLPPELAVVVVERSCKDLETPLEKKQREQIEADEAERELRREEARKAERDAKREAKKRQKETVEA
jgi:hypothetical protein